MATTGKIAEVMLESFMETAQEQKQLLPLVDRVEHDPAKLQASDNVVWTPVEQQAANISGWDLTGKEQEIIEETYPSLLGTPSGDFVKQRADKMRDLTHWRRRAASAARVQCSALNSSLASKIATQGSQFYRSNETSGYDFIAEAQAILNEEQRAHNARHFVLNDRDNLKFASDLAGRQTVQGQPADTWKTGQIANNVAEFDVHTGSYLANLAGGASPGTTVNGTQSFKPEPGSVSNDGATVTNIDYRSADIPVVSTSGYNVGDKITLGVNAIGYEDKNDTVRLKTFTVVAVPDSTTLTVFPKPIAYDDSSLSETEKMYANIDTQIVNGATVARVNTDASAKTNIFWDQDSVEVFSGAINPAMFKEFEGMKVITDTMPNGQPVYMVYDAELVGMSFRYRLFTWYGITIRDPQRCGCAVTY